MYYVFHGREKESMVCFQNNIDSRPAYFAEISNGLKRGKIIRFQINEQLLFKNN